MARNGTRKSTKWKKNWLGYRKIATTRMVVTRANHSRGVGGCRVTSHAAASVPIAKPRMITVTMIRVPCPAGTLLSPNISLKRYQIPTRTAPALGPTCAVTRSRKKFPGASAAKGTTGTRNPTAIPATQRTARRTGGRQSARMTAAGKIAQASMAPAKPSARPPANSRRRLSVTRSPLKTARAPSRQNSTSHGSSSRVRAVVTASG